MTDEATTTITWVENQDFWKWYQNKNTLPYQPYNPYPQPCPGCGRCPYCGRGPYPYWNYPLWS